MSSAPTPDPEHDHKVRTQWNLAVAVLATVFTIIVLFRYCRVLKQLLRANNSVTYSRNQRARLDEAASEDSTLEFGSHALESSILRSLPTTQFNKTQEESKMSSTECAVCLGEFDEGEWLKHLPKCSHVFHTACIGTWFQAHSNCPLCRSDVYDPIPDHETYVSMDTLLESLRREDFSQERADHHQFIRSDILMSLAVANRC